MGRVVVFTHLTLDGVMKVPGRPDEDRRGGFTHGGWASSCMDSVKDSELATGMGRNDLLFGRRTYEDFAAFWPNQPEDNPFTAVLNDSQKYVASRTLAEPLPWRNSTLLKGDAAAAVTELKEQLGKDLVVLGSGDLVQSLMRSNLVDEYVLLIHPLVLGSGRCLFPRRRRIRRTPARRYQDDHHRRGDRNLPAGRTVAPGRTRKRVDQRSTRNDGRSTQGSQPCVLMPERRPISTPCSGSTREGEL